MARPLQAWFNRTRQTPSSEVFSRTFVLEIQNARTLEAQGSALRNALMDIQSEQVRLALRADYAKDLLDQVVEQGLLPCQLGILAADSSWKRAMGVDIEANSSRAAVTLAETELTHARTALYSLRETLEEGQDISVLSDADLEAEVRQMLDAINLLNMAKVKLNRANKRAEIWQAWSGVDEEVSED